MIIGGILTVSLLSLGVVLLTNNILRGQANSEKTALTAVDQVLTEQKQFELPENTSNVPSRLDKTTLVDVVAKNQPAVVRILTIYCADVSVGSGESSFTVKDACDGGVGSGSIISDDGYISTNGHVVTMEPSDALSAGLSQDNASSYVAYLVGKGLLSKVQATSILAAFDKGTDEAEKALTDAIALIPASDITVRNVALSYAIQLGNEPVRRGLVDGRIVVDYGDSIVSAKFVDKDFDKAGAKKAMETGEFTSSDVAILKMEGNYPSVRLANNDSVKVGDQLTAIGFPAFVDGAVDTSKWQTVPSITQGNVTSIDSDATLNGRMVLRTSVQIAQGNSGGPAFNDDGEQIGLNTYGQFGNCGDVQCFGDGTIRDIADLKVLLKKNKIVMQTGGITKDWYGGLDAYAKGNYAEALVLFKKVQDAYPANYLVAPLARIAREQIGGETDTSSTYQALGFTATLLIVVGVTAVVVIIGMIVLILFFTRKHHRNEARIELPIITNTLL